MPFKMFAEGAADSSHHAPERQRKPAVTAPLKLPCALCVASHCLSREEDREVLRLGVSVSLFLELLLRDFVTLRANDPVLRHAS